MGTVKRGAGGRTSRVPNVASGTMGRAAGTFSNSQIGEFRNGMRDIWRVWSRCESRAAASAKGGSGKALPPNPKCVSGGGLGCIDRVRIRGFLVGEATPST